MLDMIDRLLEHELNFSAEESSCIAFIICSVSSCPALLLQYVPRNFYKAIGLYRASDITLRTTANEDHGLRSWQVRFLVIGIVARSLGAGGCSGRTTWSRKVTSAPSTSSNPCYGTSTSCVTAKPCVFGISWSCMKWCCLILFMTFWSKTDRALMRPALHFLLGYKLTMEL